MPINKLEQLRKYIFDIEIERTRFEQIFNSQKFVGTAKTFSIHSVSRTNQPSVLFFDRKKSQKGYVATILKGLRSTEVMSKPNDLKPR